MLNIFRIKTSYCVLTTLRAHVFDRENFSHYSNPYFSLQGAISDDFIRETMVNLG
jgi:hypothetical protein